MGRHDADTETVSAAFGRGHCALIKITAVAVAAVCAQYADHRVFDSAVLGFAVIRLNPDVAWIDIAEENAGADFERFADGNVLSIFVADLHVVDPDLRPIFSHSRFP